MVLVKNLSHYSILFLMLASPLEHVQTEILRKTTKVLVAQEKYGKELVKSLGGNLGGDLKKVILPDMRGDVACFNAPHPHECEDCCRRGSDIQGRRRPDEHG
ncbi:hypothetical protein PI124_g10319 [Phytophthora idaei]|nr:hypothetical protein PI125_g9903 [Phytophthora idaei]KAG3244923.1 hypothetical protein PI124_g10319 [Phytophthora idaei]